MTKVTKMVKVVVIVVKKRKTIVLKKMFMKVEVKLKKKKITRQTKFLKVMKVMGRLIGKMKKVNLTKRIQRRRRSQTLKKRK